MAKRKPALIDRVNNMWGPLNGDVRARLAAVLRNPTQATWRAAYSIVVAHPGRVATLWQAWGAVDRRAPVVGPRDGEPWPRIPDKMTLRRAIETALRARDARLQAQKGGR